MPKTVRMVALGRFEYAGRSLEVGEEFDCEEHNVSGLQAIRFARLATEPKNGLTYGTRAMTARRGRQTVQ